MRMYFSTIFTIAFVKERSSFDLKSNRNDIKDFMRQQVNFYAWYNIIESNSMVWSPKMLFLNSLVTKWTQLQKMLFYSINCAFYKCKKKKKKDPQTTTQQQKNLKKLRITKKKVQSVSKHLHRKYLFQFLSPFLHCFSCNLLIIFQEQGFNQPTKNNLEARHKILHPSAFCLWINYSIWLFRMLCV